MFSECRHAVHDLSSDELVRAAWILRKYKNLRLGFVDAAVIATAECRQTTFIASVEDRYLPLIQPGHFTFLPPR